MRIQFSKRGVWLSPLQNVNSIVLLLDIYGVCFYNYLRKMEILSLSRMDRLESKCTMILTKKT